MSQVLALIASDRWYGGLIGENTQAQPPMIGFVNHPDYADHYTSGEDMFELVDKERHTLDRLIYVCDALPSIRHVMSHKIDGWLFAYGLDTYVFFITEDEKNTILQEYQKKFGVAL